MSTLTSPVDIRADHLEIVQDILRTHLPAGVKVWVFGSRANWTTKDSSDLDLAVEGAASLDHGVMVGLEIAFEESDLPYTVDVVDLNAVSPGFREIVESQKVLLPSGGASGKVDDVWNELPFSEAVLVNPAVRFDRGAIYPFVDMAAVNADSRSVYSGEERPFKGSGSKFQSGDTLMARITPCLENGKIARYQAQGAKQKGHGSTEFIVIRGRPNITDNDFAYYLTQWEEVRKYAIGQMTGTSGRQRVPVDSLDHLTVPLPPLPEQRAIAHILGALDDKIELNRRMSQTLEEMARAIFQDWFVDFGPTRAKLEGREPYLPPDLWSLFPDRLVDSELGEIPEGWEVKPLSDCVDVARGLSYKGSGLGSTGMLMHNLNSVYEGGGYKEGGIKYYSGDYRERHVSQPGDVLVANTEQGHDRLLIGFAAIVPERFGEQGLFSHHLYRIRPTTSSGISPDYICQLLNTLGMHDTISGYATGTTVNMLPVDALWLPVIVLPPDDLAKFFTAIAETTRARQEDLIEESRVLAAQRDALVPKLVGGEIRTKDVSGFLDTVRS